MNPSGPGLTPTEDLERQADIARARLLKVVDALDAKRHDIKHDIKTVHGVASSAHNLVSELTIPIGAAAAGASALALSAIGAARKSWLSPKPVWSTVLRNSGMSLLAFALIETTKYGLKKLAKSKLSHD